MLDRLAALTVAVPFLLGTVASSPAASGEVVFRFEDPAIVESSGLVAADDLFMTTNDSGDRGQVFAVDPASGRTVGRTLWADEPTDVEALAPAGPGQVWVADIGDNAASRASISVSRVPVGPGDRSVAAPSYELAYPDSPRDAEALLVHPDTGRLYIATKNVFGGRLYAAPTTLRTDRVNELEALGRVMPIVTDGAFLPGGDHLVLRDYGRAIVYTFPGLETVGEVDLPEQEQGEGIAVAADGATFVSSEGRRAPVLAVGLPALPSAGPGDSGAAAASGVRSAGEPQQYQAEDRPRWPWFLTGWLGLGVIVVLLLVLRRR